MNFEAKSIHSLEKIFPEQEKLTGEIEKLSALRGETVSFQIAYRCDDPFWLNVKNLAENIEVREVALAPSEFVVTNEPDVLKDSPGLYPDPLMPINEPLRMPPNQWRTLWVTVRTSPEDVPGVKNIAVPLSVKSLWEEEPVEYVCNFSLELLSAVMPEQKLIRTEWFHTDCIYTHYNVPCWSEEHWKLLEAYFKNYSAHGNNLLLTPLWTPPLDTAVGGERPTVQLLDIFFEKGTFRFDFSKLIWLWSAG